MLCINQELAHYRVSKSANADSTAGKGKFLEHPSPSRQIHDWKFKNLSLREFLNGGIFNPTPATSNTGNMKPYSAYELRKGDFMQAVYRLLLVQNRISTWVLAWICLERNC